MKRARRSWPIAVVSMLLVPSAWGRSPEAELGQFDERGRLEVALDRLDVPGGDVIDWELQVDGVAVRAPQSPERTWVGAVRPGAHSLKVIVHYRRSLKTLVQDSKGRLGLSFVNADRWAVEEARQVAIGPSAQVRLALSVSDEPDAVDDRFEVIDSRPGNTWVEVGGPEAWQMPPPASWCERGDKAACVFDNFRRLFRR